MTPWIPWSGGECPVAPDIAITVRFRNGREYKNQSADSWSWKHSTGTSGWEVVAYRVLSADGGEGESKSNLKELNTMAEIAKPIHEMSTDEAINHMAVVEEYARNLKWSDETADYMKLLVVGNLRGFYGWLTNNGKMVQNAPSGSGMIISSDGPVAKYHNKLDLTYAQACELMQMFGGEEEGDISIAHFYKIEVNDEGDPMPAGLYAWFSDYCDEGRFYLGE